MASRPPDYQGGPFTIWRTRSGIRAEYLDVSVIPYRVRVEMRRRPEWQVDRLELERIEDGAPIDASGLRKFTFEVIVWACVGVWMDQIEEDELANDPELDLLGSKRDQQTRRTEDTKRQAVDLYRRRLAKKSKSPVQDVAKQMNLTPSYIAKLLWQARKDGLLGKAPKGRGGEL